MKELRAEKKLQLILLFFFSVFTDGEEIAPEFDFGSVYAQFTPKYVCTQNGLTRAQNYIFKYCSDTQSLPEPGSHAGCWSLLWWCWC